MNTKAWLHGLVGAFIGGASASIGLILVNPSTFNFQEGWKTLLSAFIASGLVSAAGYLKQSPLPKEEDK